MRRLVRERSIHTVNVVSILRLARHIVKIRPRWNCSKVYAPYSLGVVDPDSESQDLETDIAAIRFNIESPQDVHHRVLFD